jgi:hypothetical protein
MASVAVVMQIGGEIPVCMANGLSAPQSREKKYIAAPGNSKEFREIRPY